MQVLNIIVFIAILEGVVLLYLGVNLGRFVRRDNRAIRLRGSGRDALAVVDLRQIFTQKSGY
jgi:hypothetical protein